MRYDEGFGRWRGRGMGYDEMFRGRERHAGPPQGRRGRDPGRMGWRDVRELGPVPYPAWHQDPGPGETDFMGRPYPPASMDDRPWGLIEQDRRQARAHDYRRGYDAGYRRARYDVEYDVRPEDYHPRFIPDSDEAGMDVPRYARGPRMRYTSDWTRWF